MRAVITGATKGIGLAIAQLFAQNQMDLAICSRNAAVLGDTAKYLESLNPEIKVWSKTCDVLDKSQINDWCHDILSEWESLDILVNNAGVFMPGSIISEPDDNLETLINTNLMAAYRFTRLLLPALQNSSSAHIFNMCSIASIKAYANGGSYAISKAALYGFNQCLREELKPTNIKVTAVLPGATWTPSWQGSGYTEEQMMASMDIAEMILAISKLSKNAVVEEIILRPQKGDL